VLDEIIANDYKIPEMFVITNETLLAQRAASFDDVSVALDETSFHVYTAL